MHYNFNALTEQAAHQVMEAIETSLARVSKLPGNIVEIRFTQQTYEVEPEDMENIYQAVQQTAVNLGAYSIIVIPGKYGSISIEAREKEVFASGKWGNAKALAIVTEQIHQRLLGKLFLKLKKNKPKFEQRFFKNEESALKWLGSLLQPEDS